MPIHWENKKLLFIVSACSFIFRLFMCGLCDKKRGGENWKNPEGRGSTHLHTFWPEIKSQKRTRASDIKKAARIASSFTFAHIYIYVAYLQADRNNKDKDATMCGLCCLLSVSLAHLLLFMLSPSGIWKSPIRTAVTFAPGFRFPLHTPR